MCVAVFALVQLLVGKGAGVDMLTANKIEDTWAMALEQVRVTMVYGTALGSLPGPGSRI